MRGKAFEYRVSGLEPRNARFGVSTLFHTSRVEELAEDPASLRMTTSFVVGRVPSSRSFCPSSALIRADLPAHEDDQTRDARSMSVLLATNVADHRVTWAPLRP